MVCELSSTRVSGLPVCQGFELSAKNIESWLNSTMFSERRSHWAYKTALRLQSNSSQALTKSNPGN